MSVAVGKGVMAFGCAAGAICCAAANLLVLRDSSEKIGGHRRIAEMALGDRDGSEVQCFYNNSKMDVALDPAFRVIMLARVPHRLCAARPLKLITE